MYRYKKYNSKYQPRTNKLLFSEYSICTEAKLYYGIDTPNDKRKKLKWLSLFDGVGSGPLSRNKIFTRSVRLACTEFMWFVYSKTVRLECQLECQSIKKRSDISFDLKLIAFQLKYTIYSLYNRNLKPKKICRLWILIEKM